ncbi:hypothetical protein RND71_039061 [Anisodus tanguticus]|uniref:Carboxypeptidase A inhibitor-like domain-containing protein n=1 Tax=Anisodus tanguticus TaxID=243964 RepID=A0AAE1QVY2_9SOLA|nr:hypothetical protein RND71_039061 [Anisodus tanguticus]
MGAKKGDLLLGGTAPRANSMNLSQVMALRDLPDDVAAMKEKLLPLGDIVTCLKYCNVESDCSDGWLCYNCVPSAFDGWRSQCDKLTLFLEKVDQVDRTPFLRLHVPMWRHGGEKGDLLLGGTAPRANSSKIVHSLLSNQAMNSSSKSNRQAKHACRGRSPEYLQGFGG